MALLSTLLGACIGNFLNFSLHQWKKDGRFFASFLKFSSSPKTNAHHHSLPGSKRHGWQTRSAGLKARSWKNAVVPTLTASLFGLSYLRFQNQWFLVVESFFLVSFMVLLASSDFQWRLLPHPFTNLFILTGLLFRNGLTYPFPGSFVAVSDCLVTGSILFAVGQMIRQGLGGGDVKMASGLAIWIGLPKCFLALLAAFTAGSLFVLPLLVQGKATGKTPIPLGPYLAAGALLIWFCPKGLNPTGMGL